MRRVQTGALPVPLRDSRWSRLMQNEKFWGYFFIAPVSIGLIVFSILPLIASLALSFTNWDGSDAIKWVWFDNFTKLFHDQVYLKSVRVSTIYAIVTVPASISLSIIVAVLLNRKMRGNLAYRLIFFLPSVTMPVAIAVVWKWLYNYNSGMINYALSLVGIQGPHWLADERVVLWSVMIIAIWTAIGHHMIILLSGLQGIPESYYEAAAIDGATGMRRFWYITVPLLTPAIFFVMVTSLIGAFQVFDLVYMLTPVTAGGGSGGVLQSATRTAVYSIYQNGFKSFKIGYASAQAWMMFVVIFLVTMGQLYLQKKWVHYE
ncbi:MAG: sugar ABC transporter permease [Paenibacillaceae bacterium]|uniref:carbohydrate ABC transporter permease n=1 Tax=Paenibacillus cymbidii TaxID=1639034 RepID=UPI001081E0C4|nr:sugar ABC transporter permease [Paenibacillus cymbidii]MBO9607795.1 sugar ABC transporter permease [Paenibacillaceae bacterium]